MTKFYKPISGKGLSLKGIEFPIGFVMITVTNTNPGTFTIGTWELINISSDGGILVQYDADNGYFDLPGENHGSAYGPGSWNSAGTSLTVDQLPAHTHGSKTLKGYFRTRRYNGGNLDISLQANGICSGDEATWSGSHGYINAGGANKTNPTLDQISINASHEHNSVGKGAEHKHLVVPPYITVCMWKRVS